MIKKENRCYFVDKGVFTGLSCQKVSLYVYLISFVYYGATSRKFTLCIKQTCPFFIVKKTLKMTDFATQRSTLPILRELNCNLTSARHLIRSR